MVRGEKWKLDIFDALQTVWLMILCMIWWSFTLGGNWNSVKSTTAKHLLTALQSVLDLIAYSNAQLADSSSFHDMDAKLCFYTVLNRIKINHNSAVFKNYFKKSHLYQFEKSKPNQNIWIFALKNQNQNLQSEVVILVILARKFKYLKNTWKWTISNWSKIGPKSAKNL